MGSRPLLPPLPFLLIQWIRFGEVVQIGLSSQATEGKCPRCGGRASRVHSHHVRTVADSPAHGRTIELKIQLRRFFCVSPDCPQATFAEQMPELMHRRSRKTWRLVGSLQAVGLALGAEAGARLAEKLNIPVSPDTLLRLIRKMPEATVQTPRVLGVDDWSFKCGRRYGTILCDLESHEVVDLLPDRSAASLSQWLTEHPGVELISRDRGGEYAKGAALGAPKATQVADRFHLVHNLIEAFERGLDCQHALLAEVGKTSAAAIVPAQSIDPGDQPAAPPPAPSRREQRHQQSRDRRKARYDQVKQLQAQGVSLRQIARQLRLNSHTVQRYAHAPQFPEHASYPAGPKTLDEFMADLKQRWEQGCHNAVRLHRELQERGFGGSIHMVRRQLAAWRQPPQRQVTQRAPSPWRPSARAVGWLLLKEQKSGAATSQADLTARERVFLAALHQKWPQLAENVWMIHEFSRVLAQDDPAHLQAWVDLASEPSILRPIRQFAKNLRRDWDAVVQAVRQPWSNGQVEGQVNRLKMIKRQMYGRANFDLLRARVLLMN
jgi:transposase